MPGKWFLWKRGSEIGKRGNKICERKFPYTDWANHKTKIVKDSQVVEDVRVWPLGAASRLELEFRGHEPRVLPLHYAAICTAFCPDAANRSKKNRRIKMPFLVLGWDDWI